MTEVPSMSDFDAVSRGHSVNYVKLVMALAAKGVISLDEIEAFEDEATAVVDHAMRFLDDNEPRYPLGGFSEN